jgi:hypothetical protein
MALISQSDFHSVRREMRFPTNFKAILSWDNNYAFAQVADIADCGLRLIGDDLPVSGQRVRIGARGLNQTGLVVWRSEHGCGLVLHEPINALRVVRSNCFPAGRRIGKEVPLGAIRPAMLAERLLETFPTEETALAFLRGGTETLGPMRPVPARESAPARRDHIR